MLKRRRGVVVKCAVLIAAFWLGFALYANTVSRSNDYGRPTPSAARSAPHVADAEAGQHMPMPPTAPPDDWLAGRDDDKARRDRELQQRFRRDQAKLRELLDGRKNTSVSAPPPAPDLQQYDPQTAGLIRLGLIVPKWNLTVEVAEHLGSPGNMNLCCADLLIKCM